MIKLASLLKESPDAVYANGEGIASFQAPDAYSFILDPNSTFYIYASSANGSFHSALAYFLEKVFNKSKDKESFKTNLLDGLREETRFIASGDLDAAYDFINKHNNKHHSRKWGIAGRIWTEKKIISFWHKRPIVVKMMNRVEDFIKNAFDQSAKDYKYDFVDSAKKNPMLTYDQLINNKVRSKIDSLSDKDIKDLMKAQHLNPNAKKILNLLSTSGSGSDKLDRVARNAGYRSAAEFMNDYSLAAENTVLKEDPDNVYQDDKPLAIANWSNDDAYPFFIDPDSDAFIYTESDTISTHDSLGGRVRYVYTEFLNDKEKFINELNDRSIYVGGDLDKVFAFIGKHLKNDPRTWGFSGRLWNKKKIISFWERKDDIMSKFYRVENFLKSIKKDPNKFNYDFVDTTLFTYEELVGSSKHSSKEISLSDEQIKDLMKRQHLDPNAKKELAKLSSSGSGSDKLDKVAQDAGYRSAVEFMNDYALAEENKIPKLSSLIEHIKIETDLLKDDVKKNLLREFVLYVREFLGMKGYVPIIIVDKNEVPTTTAYFNPVDMLLKVAIKGRAMPDYLRSLAHEMVHQKQHELGQLHDKSGKTGSKQENQANTLAGIIMRNFSQKHPEIYD
jgi:hypothetical protein